MRHRKRIGLVGLIALLVALVTACQAKPPDRRADAQLFTNQMRTMPGVAAASDDVADSLAQGMVYFSVYVDAANDLTGDQLAAVTARYLRELRTGKYAGYRTELDVRRGWNVFAVDSGRMPITNRDQILQQARDWVALRREFPGATIRLRATIAHPGGQMPIQEYGHSNTATLTLNGGADYTAVAATVRSLSTGCPDLTAIDWTISAGKDHPAQIATSRRLPTAAEIGVWTRLNADQSIPHSLRPGTSRLPPHFPDRSFTPPAIRSPVISATEAMPGDRYRSPSEDAQSMIRWCTCRFRKNNR